MVPRPPSQYFVVYFPRSLRRNSVLLLAIDLAMIEIPAPVSTWWNCKVQESIPLSPGRRCKDIRIFSQVLRTSKTCILDPCDDWPASPWSSRSLSEIGSFDRRRVFRKVRSTTLDWVLAPSFPLHYLDLSCLMVRTPYFVPHNAVPQYLDNAWSARDSWI